MQGFFDMREAPLNFSYDFDEVIHVEATAGRTRHHRDATRAQAERLHNLPRHANFFLMLRRERNTNRVADAFVQKNAKPDRRFDRAGECRAGFSHAEMKRDIRSPGNKTKVRKLTIGEARRILHEEEADKLLDQDAIAQEALDRAQNDGIIFVDEIDKIVSSGGGDGPDVSREGVQRDLLSVVEGCAVYTRYGHVRTDHVLFLAAGAFHFHKPSELIPELQGRFPVRVALQSLTEADFVRILAEPKNSLTRQYVALFATEDVELTFTKDGLERLAALAFRANKTTQDIGARRLMTILEKCLEDLSFDADERRGQKIVVDRKLVDERLGETGDDADLIAYRL